MQRTIITAAIQLIAVLLLFPALQSFAAEIPFRGPGSVNPGVMGNILSQQPPQMLRPLPAVKSEPEKSASTLGPEAEKIKFKLTKIIIEDNHVYSDEKLSSLFKDKLNTEISVAELQEIVQSITNYYRNNGYILSRAILPPQHVSEGVVHVRVLEGYIDKVKIVGSPKGARKILQTYGDKIAQSRPLQIKVMEHYLRLANEVPGLIVKAVLEPSKDQTGASDLNLTALEKTVNASLSYDNYGTLYIGPLQWTANVAFNSIMLSGDATRVSYVTTTQPQQLKFYDISYQMPLGSNGTTMAIGTNHSATQPGLDLEPLDIEGDAPTYYINLAYPVWRTREKDLTLDGGFTYLDSTVTSFGFPLYVDHVRPVRFGGNYSFADRYRGSNLWSLHVEQGLNILGASQNGNETSRFDATGVFSKINAQIIRLQQITGRYSAFFTVTGQYAFNPLVSSEQFGFGGSQLGRGYDPAEIIGDRGFAGSIELRADYAPGWFLMQTLEPYVFYDAGVIWNIENVVGVPQKQSATSIGFGSRFVFTKNLTGNLMWGQPLTKTVAAEAIVGRGWQPRVFFQLVASI